MAMADTGSADMDEQLSTEGSTVHNEVPQNTRRESEESDKASSVAESHGTATDGSVEPNVGTQAETKKMHEVGVMVDEPNKAAEDVGFDVVGIHGLHGQSRGTWSVPNTTWLAFAFSAATPKPGRVILYGYDSNEESGSCYTLRGIYREAKTLLDNLLELRTLEIKNARRPIFFVSHDIGGLIVKAVLVVASNNQNKYADILHSTRAVIFHGYPHRPLSAADLEEQLFRLLSLRKDHYEQGHMMRLVKSLATTVTEVNDAFIHTSILAQAMLVNRFSTHSDPSVRIFDIFTAQMGTPFEYRLSSPVSHLLLTSRKPNPLENSPDEDWLAGSFSDDVAQTLRKMLRQTPPIYPSLQGKTGLNSPELDSLGAANGNRILHIRSSSDTNLVTERVRNHLDASKLRLQVLLYYRFNAHDIRFSNVKDMFETFFVQIAHNSLQSLKWSIENVVERVHKRKTYTAESGYSDWEFMRSKQFISDAIHVLGCLDECDDSALWFLSRLRNYVTGTESRLKLVIITTKGSAKDKLIADALSKFPSDVLAHIDYTGPIPVPVQVRFEVSMLLQEDSRYAASGLQDDVAALIEGCTTDEELCLLFIQWLRSTRDPMKSIPQLLTQRDMLKPELIFEIIMADIPDERQTWARKLLSWILLSTRPLRAHEFCTVSDICLGIGDGLGYPMLRDEPNGRRGLTDILQPFGGMLVVIHDEVQFSHGAMRRWFESEQLGHENSAVPKWYQQKTTQDRHLDILETCMAYLQDDTVPREHWGSQLPYAIQFWTTHYQQASPTESVLDTIFEQQSIFQRWIDAYMSLPAPLMKPFGTKHTPLPIAAHFGLQDIVLALLRKYSGDAEQIGQALVEAARAGRLPTLRLILDSYVSTLDFDDVHLHDAANAAAHCGNRELFRFLVFQIPNPVHEIPPRKVIEEAQKDQRPPKLAVGSEDSAHDSLKDHESSREDSKDETSKDEKPQVVSNDPFAWLAGILCRASGMGMDDIIGKLISLGADPNPPESELNHGMTPLHIAASNNWLNATKSLVDAKANMHARTDDFIWETPLHAAAAYGCRETVEFLLERGASIDARDAEGWLPLLKSCEWGHFATVEALLKHKDFREYVKPDDRDPPLVLSAYWGQYKVVEVLLRYEADPNAPDPDGETALWHAANTNRIDICRLLLNNKADPNVIPEGTTPPLVEAVKEANLEMIKLLVEHGANINGAEILNSRLRSRPLHNAIVKDETEIVRYLLSKGADPDLLDENGWTAIWTAARYGKTEMARIVAEANADVELTCTTRRWTPLHAAFDFYDTARVLLEYGADVNNLSGESVTPLARAIAANEPRVVEVMLNESKTTPDLTLTSNQNALRQAVMDGYAEVVSLLLEAGADVNLVDEDNRTLISHAISYKSEAVVRVILEYHPDLDMKNKNQSSVLYFISEDTPVASVRLLVNAGAKLGTINKFNETPLISAIVDSSDEMIRYLLTKKAAISTLNISNFERTRTPLHAACRFGTIGMVQMLIESGSNVNFVCPASQGSPIMAATCRHVDVEDGQKEKMIKLLLEKGADPTIEAGVLGYPIISASLASSAEIVKWFLDRDVPTNAMTSFGGKVVHLACYNSLEVLNVLNVPDSEFATADILGRVPLHYAVLSGQLDLVKEVLARSERAGIEINVQDKDGWTPLLWAARATSIWTWADRRTPSYTDVVSFLLDKRANTKICGRGLYKDWTALEVAYYHNADNIAGLIAARDSQRRTRPSTVKRGGQSPNSTVFCDCCLVQGLGVHFECTECDDYVLCFKCYASRLTVHPEHDFKDVGYDWDSDASESSEKTQSEAGRSVRSQLNLDADEASSDSFDDEIVGEDDRHSLAGNGNDSS